MNKYLAFVILFLIGVIVVSHIRQANEAALCRAKGGIVVDEGDKAPICYLGEE